MQKLLTRIECSMCATSTWADASELEPHPTQTAPGMVEFIVHCNDCGRAQLARENRARWEAETGRAAPPVQPESEPDGGRDAEPTDETDAGRGGPAAAEVKPPPRDIPAAVEAAAPESTVPVVEGVMRPSAGAPSGSREFDYLCPHCRTVTRIDGQNYDLLTFYRRGGAADDLNLPSVFAPFIGPTLELIKHSTGDDFLAFRCTGCAAPVVAVITCEALTHARNLYQAERVYELRSWPAHRA